MKWVFGFSPQPAVERRYSVFHNMLSHHVELTCAAQHTSNLARYVYIVMLAVQSFVNIQEYFKKM